MTAIARRGSAAVFASKRLVLIVGEGKRRIIKTTSLLVGLGRGLL